MARIRRQRDRCCRLPRSSGRRADRDPVPMASITEVVTALTVLDAHPLGIDEAGPSVTMTAADVALYRAYQAANGKVAPVSAGQVYTQRELLDLTLIESANNYSSTAGEVGIRFGGRLSSRPRSLGRSNDLPSMTIVDSTGLGSGNRATASDLVELGKLALADPLVADDRRHRVSDHPRRRAPREHQRTAGHERGHRHQDRDARHLRCEPPILRRVPGRHRRVSPSSESCWAAPTTTRLTWGSFACWRPFKPAFTKSM